MELNELLMVGRPFNEDVMEYLLGDSAYMEEMESYVRLLLYLRYYEKLSRQMGVDFTVPYIPLFLDEKLHVNNSLYYRFMEEKRECNYVLFETFLDWSTWDYANFHTNYEDYVEDCEGADLDEGKTLELFLEANKDVGTEILEMVMELPELLSLGEGIQYNRTVTVMWNVRLAKYLKFKAGNENLVRERFFQGDVAIGEALAVIHNPIRSWCANSNVHALLFDRYVIGFCEGEDYDGTVDVGSLDMNFGTSVYALEKLLDHAENRLPINGKNGRVGIKKP